MIERQKKLIKLFLNNPYTYLNANEIANYLNVSNRTVRNDIKTINNEFDNALIMSVKSRGFVLNTQEYEVESLHETLTPLIEKDSKIIINLGYKLLMSNKYFTLNALEKEYHLSKRELMNYLMRLQIWCEKFKVNIEIKKKKGISVVGSISNITNAILHLNQLSDDNDNVEQLILNELPKAHVETIFTIIKKTLNEYNINTSDFKIRQLVIHLILIMKSKENEDTTVSVDSEALEISNICIKEINRKLKYNLNEETSKLFSFFISYHFNKFELGVETLFIESYINRLILLMEDKIGIQFSEDKLLKENLYVHFSRTYLRLIKNIYLNNPLAGSIKKLYPFIFNVLFEVVEKLSKESGLELSEDEIAFLAIHFQSSIDRNEKNQFNVVIACYYGLGISSLLETKISKLSSQINIIDTIKLEDIDNYNFSNTDLLVITNEIDEKSLPPSLKILTVEPLFSSEDEEKIKYYLAEKKNPIVMHNKLANINIIIESDYHKSNDMLSIFDRANEILIDNKAITRDYINSALEREKFSSTYIGNGISIPHGNPDKVLQPYIVIFKSKKDIKWKQYNVNLVFFIAMSKDDIGITKDIIQTIAQLDETDVKNLVSLDNNDMKKQFLNLMRE